MKGAAQGQASVVETVTILPGRGLSGSTVRVGTHTVDGALRHDVNGAHTTTRSIAMTPMLTRRFMAPR